VRLLRECREVLTTLERRVEELGADGSLAPLAGDPDAPAARGGAA
jgi:hypothetical protein